MSKGYSALPKPPPPGSPWEPIEAARQKLDWSARKLSRAAVGPKSEGHYTLLSTRNWNAEVGTIESFIKALVDAGIPEIELRQPPASAATEAAREEAAEILVRRGYRLRDAEHAVLWAASEPQRVGQPRPQPDAERLARFGAALIDAAAPVVIERTIAPTQQRRQPAPEESRGSSPPSSPVPRGTKFRRNRSAAG